MTQINDACFHRFEMIFLKFSQKITKKPFQKERNAMKTEEKTISKEGTKQKNKKQGDGNLAAV
jgi:hypothetical protein